MGIAEPLAGETVAVSVYGPPISNVPPLGVMDRAVEVETGVVTTTFTARVVKTVCEPEVPVMVTMEFPRAAEPLAVSVSTLEPVVGLAPHEAVTPLGSQVADRLTLPAKFPTGVTVIVDVAEAP